MGYEFFIARRYIRSKHKLNFITIISIISTLGITLGVAALLVVLSVFNGFGGLVTSILVNFDPHVRITAVAEEAFEKLDDVSSLLSKTDHIKSFSPFASGKAILVRGGITSIVDVKGMDYKEGDTDWGVKQSVKIGNYNLLPEEGKDGIVIGLNLATKIQALTGDTLVITSFNNLSKSAINLTMPVVRTYSVRGIFESNNNDYDMYSVFTSFRSAQKLLGMNNRFHGFEIRLDNIENAGEVKNYLESKLDPQLFRVYSWYDLHNELYTMMQIERWAAYIIVSLIIAVASFNMLGSLSMSVIEKKKDIGILRSIGAKDKSILRIFMFEGMLIGITGTIAGILLGLFVAFLQLHYKIYPLDPSKYIIDALPMELRLSDFLATAGMSLFLSFIASIYPARRAVKVPALEAIKWE